MESPGRWQFNFATRVNLAGRELKALLRPVFRDRPERAVLSNASFLVATTAIGSLLGFVFWIVAARTYSVAEVGLGAAYISAATLVAAASELGLGTAIIRFAPRMKAGLNTFLNACLTAVATASLLMSVLFAFGTPIWSPDLAPIQAGLPLIVFASAATAFAMTQMTDRIFVAFEASGLLLLRNLLSNAIRIAVLLLLGGGLGAIALLVPMLGASIATIIFSALVLLPRAVPSFRLWPSAQWQEITPILGYSFRNHASVMSWASPAMLYPLIVVGIKGAEAGAQFYVSWMIANLVLVFPTAVATAAFARASTAESLGVASFIAAMRLVIAVLILPVVALLALAPGVFALFGQSYVSEDGLLFPLLLMSAFPFAVNSAAIAYHRMSIRSNASAWIAGTITLVCVGLSTGLGATIGLVGFGAGWLIGQVVGVVVVLVTLRST